MAETVSSIPMSVALSQVMGATRQVREATDRVSHSLDMYARSVSRGGIALEDTAKEPDDAIMALSSVAESDKHRLAACLMAKRVLDACCAEDTRETRRRLAYTLIVAGLTEADLVRIVGHKRPNSVLLLIEALSEIAVRAPVVGHAAHHKIIAMEKRIHGLLGDMAAAGLTPSHHVVTENRKIKIRGTIDGA